MGNEDEQLNAVEEVEDNTCHECGQELPNDEATWLDYEVNYTDRSLEVYRDDEFLLSVSFRLTMQQSEELTKKNETDFEAFKEFLSEKDYAAFMQLDILEGPEVFEQWNDKLGKLRPPMDRKRKKNSKASKA